MSNCRPPVLVLVDGWIDRARRWRQPSGGAREALYSVPSPTSIDLPLSILLGLAALPESGALDPRETQDFQRPEIERLFALALEAKLPRTRPLKSWEPARLNERHLAMVMMRAGGLQQRQIAQAFGVTDSNASIVLNHPDAELLLTKLLAMKGTQTSDIEDRIRALAEPAISALEDIFSPESEVAPLKRAPLAFKMLELNGYGAKKKVEVKHQHQLNANPEQLDRLTEALRESKSIEDAVVVSSGPLPPESTGAAGSSDSAAPSSGSSQGATPKEWELEKELRPEEPS